MRSFKRLTFDVHPDLHKNIKMAAVSRGISMNLWLVSAIYKKLKEEESYGNYQNNTTATERGSGKDT